MPTHREISDDLLTELEEGGGIQAKTQAAKDRAYNAFVEYIRTVGKDDSEVTEISDEDLEKHFSRYFFTLQVKRRIKHPDGSTEVKLDWPKTNTAEFIRSMIKCSVYERHGIDLNDPHRFPNAKKHWGSLLEKIKSEGRGDTEHHEEIPPDTYEKITKLFHDAMEVLKNRGNENYQDLLSLIPLDWQHRCHQLVQYGVQFMVSLYDGRRGCEKIENLRRDQWEKKEDDVWKFNYWQKKIGEGSKNHRKDSENVSQSGIIPFLDITEFLNPGQFFTDYLELIPDHSTNLKMPEGALFPKPKDQTKNFHPHHPDTVLFEPNRKLGKHMVQEMLPTVSESILKLDRCTNHQMRVTVVKSLRRAGYDWPTVQKITGHKSLKSLIENYDPSLDTPERANIGVAIGTAPNLRRGIGFQKVSPSLARHEKEDSVAYNEPAQMVPTDLLVETPERSVEGDDKSNKKPRLDNFEMNNSLYDYGPSSSTDGGLFKIPDDVPDTIEAIADDEDQSVSFEIPEISVAELGDGNEGFNLKGRLRLLLKHYTTRRGQLTERGLKMSEEEEKRWKDCQIDYVNKAIHASNSTKLDIEIANSILRQKEVEENMSKEREKQKREEVKKRSCRNTEAKMIAKHDSSEGDNLMTEKLQYLEKNKTERQNQTKKTYQSIDLTGHSNRISKSIPASSSRIVHKNDPFIDLTISPESRGLKLGKDKVSGKSMESNKRQNQIGQHKGGLINLEPTNKVSESNYPVELKKQAMQPVGSTEAEQNLLSRPEQGMPIGMIRGQQSIPFGASVIHPSSAMTQSFPMMQSMSMIHPSAALPQNFPMGNAMIHPSTAMMQSASVGAQIMHPSATMTSSHYLPQNVGHQFVYPQMQAPYGNNFLPGHSQMLQNSQLLPPLPYMSQQYNQSPHPQQMLQESFMGTREQGLGLGQMMQQVTEKSVVRLDQGSVQATTVSMSSMRKRHPDWGALAGNKKQ